MPATYNTDDYYYKAYEKIASGAIRVCQNRDLFENRFTYDTSPLKFESVNNTGGTLSHLTNKSGVKLAIDTTSDAILTYQSKRYFVYNAGETLKFSSGVFFNGAVSGITKRFGGFDDDNGAFFYVDGNGFGVARRSKASGSVVTTTIPSSQFNIDKLDGKGPSQLTFDSTKIQMLFIDCAWYGAGYTLFGIQHRKEIWPIHIFSAGNELAEPITGAAIFPLRYEIEASGVTAGSDMEFFGGLVSSEGHLDNAPDLAFTANNGTTPIAVTTRRPVLSIRPKTTFNSITNRMAIQPSILDLLVTTNNALIEICIGGTLTSSSFNSVNTQSGVEYDVAASAISGERVISSYYIAAGSGKQAISEQLMLDTIPVALDAGGTTPGIYSVVVTSMSGTSNCAAALTWKEIR